MENRLTQAFDTNTFREEGHQLIDLLADYLQQAESAKDLKVIDWQEPQATYEYWKNYQFTSSSQFFSDVIAGSNHLHHPHYVGHQVSPSIPSSALSALVASLLKNGSGVYEMAPVGAIAERLVAEEFAKYIGYGPASDGLLTSGGTLANLTALLTARQEKGSGDVWNDGLGANQDLAVMVSGEAHYCIDRAVRIMGLGADGLIKVPVGADFKAQPEALKATYQKAVEAGRRVFAIVGSACSTATGAHDDLVAMGEFARQKGLWFHVDAAHGGAALFSQKYRHLLHGIADSDSVVIDSHKMLMTAGLATALVYREGKHSYRTFQMKAQYLFEASQDRDWYNMAKRTFECTKFMTALNTLMVFKQYGAAVIGEYVNHTYDTARAFHQILHQHPVFQTIHPAEANILCFRYFDPTLSEAALTEINKSIRDRIVQSGDFYLVQTTIQEVFYLRVCIMNPKTQLSHLQSLLTTILQFATPQRKA